MRLPMPSWRPEMARAKPRAASLLTEDRIVRALSRGGMITEVQGELLVYRGRDARGLCAGKALGHIVARMVAAGQIVRRDAKSGRTRYIWRGRAPKCDVGPPPPAVLASPSQTKATGKTRQTLLEHVLRLAEANGEAARIAAAAGRYRADIEQAATPQSVTMRWDAAPVSGGRRADVGFGPGGRAMAADARLRQLGKALGRDTLRILDEVLIRGVSAAGLARLMDVPRKAAPGIALTAMEQLAEAYDLRVKRAA